MRRSKAAPVDGVACNAYLARRRLEKSAHHRDSRGFAGSIGTEKAEDLTGGELK
jgi:hypothetical protein